MPDYFVLNGADTYSKVTIDDIVKANQSILAYEKDVQTIKDGAEQAKKNFEDKIKSLESDLDTTKSAKLTAESLVSEKDKELTPLKEQVAKLTPFETQVKELTDKLLAVETQATTSRRTALIEKYKLTDDAKAKVEAMTAEQLTSAEEAASLFGNPPQQSVKQVYRNGNEDRRTNFDDTSGHEDLVEGMKEIRTVAASSSAAKE